MLAGMLRSEPEQQREWRRARARADSRRALFGERVDVISAQHEHGLEKLARAVRLH